MARQEGTFKINGTIGDLTFYKSAGQYLVRQKGGVSGDRIKNDPNFARTRENNSEFAQAGATGKMLRDAIRNLLDKSSDSRVASRLVQHLFAILKTDNTNPRGQRRVADGIIQMLNGFEFNEKGKLSSTLFAPMTYAIDRANAQATASGNLVPVNDIKAPAGATHYKLTHAALVIDLGMQDNYELAVATTAESPLDAVAVPVDLNAVYTIDPNNKVIMQLMLIEFYQQVNGSFYTLRNGSFNALRIVGVDIGVGNPE